MSEGTPFGCIRDAVGYWAQASCGITPVWPGDDGEIWQCGVKFEAFVSSVVELGHDYVEWIKDDAQTDPTKSMVPYVCGRRDILVSLRATQSDNFKSGQKKPWEVLEAMQSKYRLPAIKSQLDTMGIKLQSPQGDVRRLDFRQGDTVSYRASMEARLRIRFGIRGCGIPAIEKVTGTTEIYNLDESISSDIFTTEQSP